MTALLVAARIASTTWANIVQKRLLATSSPSPLELFTQVWGCMTLLSLPGWISTLSLGLHFWSWLLLTCLLEVPGNVLLLRSLKHTELSIFGPLSSFKPVVSLLLAFLLFGQSPSGMGALGVGIVIVGSICLTIDGRSETKSLTAAQKHAGIRDRLLAVLLTAAASVFLKEALPLASPWQVLAAWCLASWLLAMLWRLGLRLMPPRVALSTGSDWASMDTPVATTQVTIASESPATDRHHSWQAAWITAVAMLVMQGCTISLFARMPVGYALALFQIGSLVSVWMGHRLFGEGQLVRRLLAASIMVAGACLIIAAG